MKLLVILDNGHGKETPGKRSPIWKDGTLLFEWEFNRAIVKLIAEMCDKEHISYKVLVPENKDITLGERCRRANKIYSETNGQCFLISIHANAGGGTGYEVYTSVGLTKSDKIAEYLLLEMKKQFPNEKLRADKGDGDLDKESQFYILKHTKCPALLSENFFMDTEKDCRLIMSEEGRLKVAKAHFETIKHFCNE